MSEPICTLDHARRVCAMSAVLLSAGCSAWRPLPGAGLARVDSERLGHAKVVLTNGTELELENATIRSDSITGFGGDTRTRFAVARHEVARVDARQPDAPKTFLVGGIATLSLTFLYVATIVALMYGHD